ncbi:hypothetical protein [Desulfosporosinus youngiae]|uniref:Uncharacterized protein n=1 Tax=Desulfosporosinus youngiae DSM 17734 TaxID=768710 RepID=H5Y563_9FIRM|nr:hypothetical protein [Desulfosporosinus youngiae]EHQ90167.1 hypothetical protein DesyoDRAFT_3133 [Desulfosporosinus youngiae DSM 17734]
MAKIIDLSVLVRDPLIFRDIKGEEYVIPGEVDLDFMLKINAYQERIKKVTKEEDSINLGRQMMIDILALDKSKDITMDLIKERFNDIRHMKIIIEQTILFIRDIVKDPNSLSLESTNRE